MTRSCRLLQMQVGLPAPWPIRDGGRFSNAMCLLVAALAPIGVGLLLIGSAGGVPKPPPKFWSATRCERTVLHVSGGVPPTRGFPLPDSNGHRFHVSQAICVGSGGPHACRWTAGHRSRIYSEFRVFTRSPLNGGIARSFTLATRTSVGFLPVQPHGGDKYVGWPPDFYVSSTRLVTTRATPARFRRNVAPIAARLRQQDNATGCAVG